MGERLKGKVAVVTGAGGGGVGEATALALSAEGALIVVNDIGRDSMGRYGADKAVEKISETGGRATANYDSVATMEGGENIVKTALNAYGRIDILVNCAGNFQGKPTTELTENDWDSIIEVHLKGHFSCIKAALPEMIKQKTGRIVNFSSRAAFGGGGNLAYTAAKAGILGLTTMLSVEMKEHGITVNAVLPSADTKMFPGPRPKFARKTMIEPMFLEPHYIAPMISFLATDEAQEVTGKFIYSSGGDFCLYSLPLQLKAEAPIFVRKVGKWTIDELIDIMPSLGLA
jgi:NAD(P)-dependent dehydrogenase (short-subunit alcohol dehydrogenase family)